MQAATPVLRTTLAAVPRLSQRTLSRCTSRSWTTALWSTWDRILCSRTATLRKLTNLLTLPKLRVASPKLKRSPRHPLRPNPRTSPSPSNQVPQAYWRHQRTKSRRRKKRRRPTLPSSWLRPSSNKQSTSCWMRATRSLCSIFRVSLLAAKPRNLQLLKRGIKSTESCVIRR